MNIRSINRSDLPHLKAIIAATDLFPSDDLDEMTEKFLSGFSTDECWITIDDGKPSAIAYVQPEPVTNGTWNLILIAVHPSVQGKGYGSSLIKYIETLLAKYGARLLIVETSGSPNFESTREFYRQQGYTEEARLRDFYDVGEDKIVFRKILI